MLAAAGRQRQQRLRQHRGPVVRFASDDGALPRCGAKISRLAVGDPTMPLMVNIYRLVAGAAAGRARGRSCPSARAAAWRFTAISRWTATIDQGRRRRRAARSRTRSEITVDGERVQLVDGRGRRSRRRRGGRGGGSQAAGVPHSREGRTAADRRHVCRARRSPRRSHPAAPHARPRDAARARQVTISGPYEVKSAGRYRRAADASSSAVPQRRRPSLPCARNRFFLTLVRRAYRRPVTDRRSATICCPSTRPAAPKAVSTAASRRRSNACW